MSNKLYFGDNLHILRKYIKDESVDLIYLDPPFNSNADYNVLFKPSKSRGHRAQIEAFDDTWKWGEETERTYDEILEKGGSTAIMIDCLKFCLNRSDMMAYLVMMTIRLVELHRILKSTGALYLHCDPTASHYLKIILDTIFSPTNFRSEIIWRRSGAHNSGTRQFGPVHDCLLFYAKSLEHKLSAVRTPQTKWYIKYKFKHEDHRGPYRLNELMGPGSRTGDSGKPWNGYNPTPKDRHWAIPEMLKQLLPSRGADLNLHQQLDALLALNEIVISSGGRPEYKQRPTDGTLVQDIWAFQSGTDGCLFGTEAGIDADVKWLDFETEKLGYPTQKPLGLLDRIISASSAPGDVILDPFCGCGTTVHAAQRLGRTWAGIDITHVAIHVIADRLGRWLPHAKFDIIGQPKDLAGAQALADHDKYQFQWWATWLCGGQPFGGEKKGKDRGVDGTLEFASQRGVHEWGVISVKGGRTINPSMVRDLAGTVAREKAAIGVFLCIAEPSREMELEAVSAGFVTLGGVEYRKIQIRTIEQLLQGKGVDCPMRLTTAQKVPEVVKPKLRPEKRPAKATEGQTSLLLPISGGRNDDAQKALPLDEPLLSAEQPVVAKRRRRG